MDDRALFLSGYFVLLPATILLVSIALGLHRIGMKSSARRYAVFFVLSLIMLVLLMTHCAPAAADESIIRAPLPVRSKAEVIRERIKEGERRCSTVAMVVSADEAEPGKLRIVERPIALCAYDGADDSWHVIMLHIQYPVPKEYIACVQSAGTLDARLRCILPFHVVTPGYDVEHLSGYGIIRFIGNAYRTMKSTDVAMPDATVRRKLIVYRTRHVWFDDEALATNDTAQIIASTTAVDYTPYHPDFNDPELPAEGKRFLLERIMHAQKVLRDAGVPSRAYRGKLVADVIPWQIPMALALIEQTDDVDFAQDPRNALNKVFIEYALNGRNAFRSGQSRVGAIGPYQFTDGNGDGTYSSIVRNYPEAQLNPIFEEGARDLDNVIKAAICLIDQEVAGFPKIRSLFLREPILAGIYPVAAYNGGHARAKELYGLMKAHKIALDRVNRVPQQVVTEERHKCNCGKKGARRTVTKRTVIRLNGETYGYVKKYSFLINEYLGDLKPGGDVLPIK